ncbi:hypothetical protein PG985_006286 [Apiospora marii]|uniref:Uncharacterized protein n=1 Tax=Apiospora marii TaxID=335849 RepID=A0ABR1S8I3_9PEZI
MVRTQFPDDAKGLNLMIDDNGFFFERPKEAKWKGALLKNRRDEYRIVAAVKTAYSDEEYKRMQPWNKFTECFVQLFKLSMERKDEWAMCKTERDFWLAIKQSVDWAQSTQVDVDILMKTIDLLVDGRRRFLRESQDLPKGSFLSAWVQGWIEAIDNPELLKKKGQMRGEALDVKQEDTSETSDTEMKDV